MPAEEDEDYDGITEVVSEERTVAARVLACAGIGSSGHSSLPMFACVLELCSSQSFRN